MYRARVLVGTLSIFWLFVFFFFFKQKTAYEMRISDWSSDVCSSDLVDESAVLVGFFPEAGDGVAARHQIEDTEAAGLMDRGEGRGGARCPVKVDQKIGRASCRERVCQYV